MLSISVPHTLALSISSAHLKREGPYGSFLTPTGGLNLRLLETPTGRRLFVQAPNPSSDASNVRAFLAFLSARRHGLSYGYRRRLRLVGVGFRASPASSSSATTALKLGYSHELTVGGALQANPSTQHHLSLPTGVSLYISRLEGRSKGTLLLLQGADHASVNQAASKVRALRRPDPYKGKGVHYDREVLKLKKGKGDR